MSTALWLDTFTGPVWRYRSPNRPITQLPLSRLTVVIDPETVATQTRELITARPLTPTEIAAFELTLVSEPEAKPVAKHYVIATFDSQEDLDRGAEPLYAIADTWDPSDPSWTAESRYATHYTHDEVVAEVHRLRAIPGFWTEHAFQYRPAAA